MRHQGTDRYFGIEAALRDLLRDVIRDELRYLREEIIGWIQTRESPALPKESKPGELLTVGQVASALQVVPGTVRSWIQSGALRSSRPGNGAQAGRTYRIRREDLDAFVAASEGRLALSGSPRAMPPCSVGKSAGSPRGGDEVT
jgi:excisionase family DNA binding protein